MAQVLHGCARARQRIVDEPPPWLVCGPAGPPLCLSGPVRPACRGRLCGPRERRAARKKIQRCYSFNRLGKQYAMLQYAEQLIKQTGTKRANILFAIAAKKR